MKRISACILAFLFFWAFLSLEVIAQQNDTVTMTPDSAHVPLAGTAWTGAGALDKAIAAVPRGATATINIPAGYKELRTSSLVVPAGIDPVTGVPMTLTMDFATGAFLQVGAVNVKIITVASGSQNFKITGHAILDGNKGTYSGGIGICFMSASGCTTGTGGATGFDVSGLMLQNFLGDGVHVEGPLTTGNIRNFVFQDFGNGTFSGGSSVVGINVRDFTNITEEGNRFYRFTSGDMTYHSNTSAAGAATHLRTVGNVGYGYGAMAEEIQLDHGTIESDNYWSTPLYVSGFLHPFCLSVGTANGSTPSLPQQGGSTFSDTCAIPGATAYWMASASYLQYQPILDAAGHYQVATVAGIAGGSIPTFNDSGGTTTDGTITWQDEGSAGTNGLGAYAAEIYINGATMSGFQATGPWDAGVLMGSQYLRIVGGLFDHNLTAIFENGTAIGTGHLTDHLFMSGVSINEARDQGLNIGTFDPSGDDINVQIRRSPCAWPGDSTRTFVGIGVTGGTSMLSPIRPYRIDGSSVTINSASCSGFTAWGMATVGAPVPGSEVSGFAYENLNAAPLGLVFHDIGGTSFGGFNFHDGKYTNAATMSDYSSSVGITYKNNSCLQGANANACGAGGGPGIDFTVSNFNVIGSILIKVLPGGAGLQFTPSGSQLQISGGLSNGEVYRVFDGGSSTTSYGLGITASEFQHYVPSGGHFCWSIAGFKSGGCTAGASGTMFLDASGNLYVSGNINGTFAGTLPNVGTAGTKGSSTQVPVFITDAQGRVAADTDTTIAPTAITITGGSCTSGQHIASLTSSGSAAPGGTITLTATCN